MIVVNALVEGLLDEAVAIRIIRAAGQFPGTIYGKKGCGYIKDKIQGFNQASVASYYLALVDLMDTNFQCPPEVLASWIPNCSPKMMFRVVASEVESWLLADRENIADFLKVSVDKVPNNPEQTSDPKRTVINLARRSRSSRIRSTLVPEPGTTAQVGKLYTSEMINFINSYWNIESARHNSPSLDRCLNRLKMLS